VSGGFTRFAEPVAAEIGFCAPRLPIVLDIAAGALAGTVQLPIVDSTRKRSELEEALIAGNLDRVLSMAVGDGAK